MRSFTIAAWQTPARRCSRCRVSTSAPGDPLIACAGKSAWVRLWRRHSLPWNVMVSAIYQFSRGIQNPAQPSIVADWAVPNAIIAQSLGRSLASGGTKTVRLIELT